MKVLMISEYFPPASKGGGEISAFLLAKSLVKKKIEMHVMTSSEKEPYFELIDGIKVHRHLSTGNSGNITGNIKRLKFNRNLKAKVRELDAKEDFDIIHCMNTSSISAVKCIDKPFIMHVNGPVPFCPKGTLMYKDKESCDKKCTSLTYVDCALNSKMVGRIEFNKFMMPLALIPLRQRYNSNQSYMKRFDYYMPISRFMEKKLLDINIKKSKVKIIYNFIDKHSQANNRKGKKILFLGDYTKTKGADLALKVINALNAEANFYGEGNLEQYLKENANKKTRINSKISYNDVSNVIAEHDIVLFPSFVGEAFGRVALEACSLGKTVIASRIGGVTDIIEHGVTGFLFEPGNEKQLKELLSETLSGKLKLDSSEIIKKTDEKFLESRTVSAVIEIYKKLAKQF